VNEGLNGEIEINLRTKQLKNPLQKLWHNKKKRFLTYAAKVKGKEIYGCSVVI